MTATLDIEKITNWSEGKRVNTRNGPRILHTSIPTESFWKIYRSNKQELGVEGVSVGKDRNTGEWQAMWWKQLPQEELEQMKRNLEDSQKVSADIEIVKPDNSMDYYPYQKVGIGFSRGKSGVLIGDDMGLGKTIQAIGVINDRPETRKVLIVCPASVKRNWYRELHTWLYREFDIAIVKGKNYPAMADIVIINYDLLGKHNEVIEATQWDMIIADEAHFIKSLKAKRTKALIALVSKMKMALTGTPILNKISEIFPMLHWLNPETFPHIYNFLRKFSDGKGNASSEDRARLQKVLRETLMVRRLKSEVLTELPPKQRQVIELDPPPEVLLNEKRSMEPKDEEKLAILEAALELAKVSDDPEQYEEALSNLRGGLKVAFESVAKVRHETAVAKLPYTIRHVHEVLETVDKVVIWAHHRDCIEILRENIPNSVIHYGGMTEKAKDDAITKFVNDPSCPAFIGSIRAAGMGINGLQKVCTTEIFHEIDWVPAMMSQAEDRLHRIGQDGSVLVQIIVFSDSLDCNMAHKNVAKMNLADQCLDKDRDKLLNEPVAPSRGKRKGRITVTNKEVEEVSIDPSARSAIHLGLQMLSGVCDGANQQDGAGFNKFDSHIGKELANMPSLSSKQAILGRKLVRKYKRQLPEDLVRTATQ